MEGSSRRTVKLTLYDLGLTLVYLHCIFVVIILAIAVNTFFWVPAVILSSVFLIKGFWALVREKNPT